MSDKTFVAAKKERLKTNEGLISKLVGTVKYAVRARNGSLIPCVAVGNFSVIHANLPGILQQLRYDLASSRSSKMDGGWRYSHGNNEGNLPEFTVGDKLFANPRERMDDFDHQYTDSIGETFTLTPDMVEERRYGDERPKILRSDEQFQQFQEYDISHLLNAKPSKEVDDLGAMRAIVDECFQHVYFTTEHYRPVVEGKITKAMKEGKAQIQGFNPFIFVLFEPPPQPQIVTPGKKKQTGPSQTDLMFQDTNITEEKFGSKNATDTYNGMAVTVIMPHIQRRGRRNSLILPYNQDTTPMPPT